MHKGGDYKNANILDCYLGWVKGNTNKEPIKK